MTERANGVVSSPLLTEPNASTRQELAIPADDAHALTILGAPAGG
jgi:hypothetical protein